MNIYKIKNKLNSRSDIAIQANRLSMSKRSQSEVIGTVLLILVVIVAVVVLIGFIMPFVKNQFSGAECFEVTDKVSIRDKPEYTCYDTDIKRVFVQVHVGDTQDKINGFAIELGGAASKTYEITNKDSIADVVMYNGSVVIRIPGRNEDRTYNISISSRPDSINLYPILKSGKTCDSSSVIDSVPYCS